LEHYEDYKLYLFKHLHVSFDFSELNASYIIVVIVQTIEINKEVTNI